MYPTRDLAGSPLFRSQPGTKSQEEQIALSYLRAKAITEAYSLTVQDILRLSPKFWQLHTDPIWAMDGAAGTLTTIQLNLCAGTLANFVQKQSYLNDTIQKVLSFKIVGQFCLTEVGHGLDALHIETTATLLENGKFELNTPSERAAKYMPPTKPMGDKCIAVVFARTIVNAEDCGIKSFLVPINDGVSMYPGIVCKCLPQRGGSKAVNHSLTYFHNVVLPGSSLLGTLEKPNDEKSAFFTLISRVAIGTLAIGSLGVPALQVSSYIAAQYSMRRMVTDRAGRKIPIMSFRTQKTPILTALAQYFVMKSLHEIAVPLFLDESIDSRVRHAIATIVKVVMMQHGQAANLGLGDRCGAQGLFEYNQFSVMFADMRGTAISEGDTLGLSIRLASELLLGRYDVPAPADPDSLLSRHEKGLFQDLRNLLRTIGDHRHPDYDRYILPECFPLVQAIGHRMAYDAAVITNVDQCIIDIYVASCVKADASWYVENTDLTRQRQRELEAEAVDAVFPHLQSYLTRLDIDPYITAPIVSEGKWNEFINELEPYIPTKTILSSTHQG
ncbi:hypothetical protein M422DRAFT_259672 [Sphaerobolus stellatus SS14]|uniref:Acyl-CoA oxidase C-alpha1 domain-containing protein n=1 Tax=Sphaerobolus stellatus (strain SS14) TaxID=990650 RepID=A0A0C9USL3_SPHS4|nr:hypothetical protein M422DRAFT_259672 [Sphaerobolus stellatus SS14]